MFCGDLIIPRNVRLLQCGIVDVMSEDPRSVYLRTKYGSQIFTFQLGEVTVTCKFDDLAARVTIVRIRRTQNLPAQDPETTAVQL